jgi:hypothetical protein
VAQNWQFIAAGSQGTGANPSPGLPAGWQQGDLLVIIAGSTTAYSSTPPSGYVQGAREASAGFGGLAVWWKAAGSSESAPSLTNAATTAVAQMLCYRNVVTTAVDATSSIASGGSGSANAGAVVTSAADDLILHCWSCTTSGAGTWTDPLGSPRINSGNSSTLVGLLSDDEDQATAGATTARTGTISRSIGCAGVTLSFMQSMVGDETISPTAGAVAAAGNAPTVTPALNVSITPTSS